MDIPHAAQLAFKNKLAIKASNKVGCYHCKKIYEAKEVTQFTDKGETAICPKCGIDAVLGDAAVTLDEQVLQHMSGYWFGVIKPESKSFKL